MTDVLTTAKSLTKQTVGGNSNTWGTILNSTIELVDKAIAQQVAKAIVGNASVSGAEAAYLGVKVTGTISANATLTWPTYYGPLVVTNSTVGGFLLVCGMSGGTVAVGPGETALIFSDGTDFKRLSPTQTINAREYGMGLGGDDSALMVTAVAAAVAANGAIFFPPGVYRIAGTTAIALANVALLGASVNTGYSPYTTAGSVIQIENTTSAAFTVGRGVTLDGLTFFYPGQDGVAVSPVVYPELLAATDVERFRVSNCTFVNPYVLMKVAAGGATGGGDLRFHNVRCYAVDKAFWLLSGFSDIFQISDSMFSGGVYGDVFLGGNAYLAKYTAASGEFMRIDCGAATKTTVDGLMLSNTLIYGSQYGIRLLSGAIDVSSLTGNIWDSISTLLSVEGTASIYHTQITGGECYAFNFYSTTPKNVFNLNSSSGTIDLDIDGVKFSYTYGNYIFDSGAGSALNITLSGNSFENWGQTPTLGTYYALGIAASTTDRVLITGNKFETGSTAGIARWGIAIANASGSLISGNSFEGCTTSVGIVGGTTGTHLVIGNRSLFTPSPGNTLSDLSSGSAAVYDVLNAWDIAPVSRQPSLALAASGCLAIRVDPIAPSTSSDTGAVGQLKADATYIYICTATNTWKRVALSSF